MASSRTLSILPLGAMLFFPMSTVFGKMARHHPLPPQLIQTYQPSEFLVEGLENIEAAFGEFDGKMYAGRLPIDIISESDMNDDDYIIQDPKEARGEYMFWLFEPTNATAMDTVTVWLNGGPGCSSFFAGVMFECAPVTTPHHPAGYPKSHYDEPLVVNDQTWTKATNMLFVEQPGGVGFSSGPTPDTEADVSEDFYNFLVNFFSTFKDYQEKRLFIFGESYAGYYVPSIAHKIHRENKYGTYRRMNLAGVGLGNAWMDAMHQGPTVVDFAWWHGMIDTPTRNGLHAAWDECQQGGDSLGKPFHSFTIPDECGVVEATLMAAGAGLFPDMSPNTYDVTTWDMYPLLFEYNSTILQFYNNPKVKEALHAPMDVEFQGCIPGAGRRRRKLHVKKKENEEPLLPGQTLLAHDKPDSVVPYLAELLDDAGVRVLVYNGDRDLSCNAPGSELLLDNMIWNGMSEWKHAARGVWLVDGVPSGYSRSYSNLDFLVVSNSGHLVPNNRPVEALDLITRMVTDQRFNDVLIPKLQLPRSSQRSKATVTSVHHDAHAYFQALILLLVAVVCFFSGMVAAAKIGWGSRNTNHRREDYTTIPNDEELEKDHHQVFSHDRDLNRP